MVNTSKTHIELAMFFVGYGDFTFWARISADTLSPIPAPVIFDDDRINPGGHYDATTGITKRDL